MFGVSGFVIQGCGIRGFEVSGSRFRGFRVGVPSSGFRVLGWGFRVWGLAVHDFVSSGF